MKRILMLVFSGTGNTIYVAERIAHYLRQKDCTVKIISIKEPFTIEYDIKDYDLIGFGYPVHAFNIPKIYREFIATIPIGKETPAFVFKSSGEPFKFNNASSAILVKRLRKKGYLVYSDTHFLMPYNIIFRYPKAAVKEMLYYADALSKILAHSIIIKKQQVISYKWRYRFISFIFRIQYLGARLNGPLMRARHKKCSKCMLCLKQCPTKNIYIKKGKIKFSNKCTMCMRCVMACPNNAINIGFLNHWKVNGPYQFSNILEDNSIENNFFDKTKSTYFRHFINYYKKLDISIKEYETNEIASHKTN